jgi:hypothetical protein
MLSSKRLRIELCCVVGFLGLVGWGLTSAVMKVRQAAARAQGL